VSTEEEIAQLIRERDGITQRIYLLRKTQLTVGRTNAFETSGDFAGLTARSADFLRKAGIGTRAHLADYLAEEGGAGLRRLRGIGPISVREVEKWLKQPKREPPVS
jgi:hypothetical protein